MLLHSYLHISSAHNKEENYASSTIMNASVAYHQDERSQELSKELSGMNEMHSSGPGLFHIIFSCFFDLDETLAEARPTSRTGQAVVAARGWLGK